MIITDTEKIDLATRVEPVIRRHEAYFLGPALADISCRYAQWREGWCSHDEAMLKVQATLTDWYSDTFDFPSPSSLLCITPHGSGWQQEDGNPWIWRGSTDFRLLEQVSVGRDILPILQDRKAAGANLVRILAMKANNTGWAFDPRRPDYADVVRRTFDALAIARLYGELTVLADTKLLRMAQSEQQDVYDTVCHIVRDGGYAGTMFVELVNEAGHETQQVNPDAFAPPTGIIASHGSGLSDVEPPQPFWGYATYHARRQPPYPSAKTAINWDASVFNERFPMPCPFICEEGLKPAQYGYDPTYAFLMGQHARINGGGTFHHDAWNEARVWTDQERACAQAFYRGLGVVR